MPADLDFTGERFLPGVPGEIAYEHWHRYAFAQRFVGGRRVLDAACGEGYGSALLAGVAAAVTGVDIDAATVAHARAAYAGRANLRFETGSVAALPLPDDSVDVVVSFETIEHLPAADQPAMLAEFARVLAPGGVLVISSPNKRRYSDDRHYVNPFHLHELYRDDFARALGVHFPHCLWFHQTPVLASALWGEGAGGGAEAWVGDGRAVSPAPVPDGIYYVVVAAKDAAALPATAPALSLFTDRDETELARAAHNASEALRLDALLKERTEALDRASAHVRHLEGLVAVRDQLVLARDGELAAVNAARAEHERALIALRTSVAPAATALAATEAKLATTAAALAEAREALAGRDATLAANQAALAAQEAAVVVHEAALNEHAAALVARDVEVAAHAAEITRLRADVADLTTDLAARGRELRDARQTVANFEAENRRLDAALTAQERIIAYRQSVRWWVALPWLRVKLAWQRLKGR